MFRNNRNNRNSRNNRSSRSSRNSRTVHPGQLLVASKARPAPGL